MPEQADPGGDAEVLCERRGAAGMITLNRPQALNALTHAMVHAIRDALDAWAVDPAVTRVIVRAAGERAFCAGGDIRHLYDLGSAGRQDEMLPFWRDEYALNVRIKHYPKPYVSLIDGIVMGGGVGVSLHGSHRVAGDRYAFAMPEVGIGFFPDVGATYALPRLPGRTGTWIALTGERVRAADAVSLGLATHHVPSARHGALIEALIAAEDVETVLARLSGPPDEGSVGRDRALIDDCFAAETVEGVLAQLDATAARGAEFAHKTSQTIRSKSPTSLKVAHEQMRRGPGLSFAEAMATEFRIVARIVHRQDFYEGVRAAIIDKDGAPRWCPATLEEVSPEDVARYFAPLGPDELAVAPS